MEAELQEVSTHMLKLGLGALSHANWHATTMSFENRFWPELSVIQAAHAAEILIKARIAQEHPLLIFEHLPKPESSDTQLTIDQLVKGGRTYQYSDLPGRLWATTGNRIPNRQAYDEFGRLRNAIQHFTSPKQDCSYAALEFIYGVIDPFLRECWGLFAVDYTGQADDQKYLVEALIGQAIPFLVSDDVMIGIERGWYELSWPEGNKEYALEMKSRIEQAQFRPRKPTSFP